MALNEPVGTYTFLFTDIEGSTHLWETRHAEMSLSLAEHDRVLREVFEGLGGRVFKTVGDACCVVFDTPARAVRAAVEGQIAVAGMQTPIPLRVRMALHSGSAEPRDNDFFGRTVNRVARLLSGGHGGQILVSGATRELTRDSMPDHSSLIDLGEHRLRDLARPEHVYQLVHPKLGGHFPTLRTLDSLPNNLPQQTTRFVGRDRELSELRDMLSNSRLVTIAGSGGAGKTRVSLQLSADLVDRFPHGVWLVELASVDEPSRLPSVIGEVLGVAEQPGTPIEKTLRIHLREKELLVVLDNCEHLIDAAASFVDGLLRSCAKIRVLASSREPLNVAGEQIYRLPPLRTPDHPKSETAESLEQYEAVELFVDRARQVLPSFLVEPQNAHAVAGICCRLNGIPLALELAASRLRSLSPSQVHERLDDAFRILTGGSRTALPRQQTLRGAIDWSYNLLEEKERVLLRRLSVFSGGWDLAASEVVATDPEGEIEKWEVLDLLSSLVDKSLVVVDERAGETRYRLLETVRQYAVEKLGDEADVVRDRHLAYFFELAKQAAAPTDANSGGALGLRLYRQSDNVRAALLWAVSSGKTLESAVQFTCHLHRTCLMRWNASEVCGLWDRLLTQSVENLPGKLLTDAYAHASWYAGNFRDVEKACAWAEKGIAVAQDGGDSLAVGRVLNALGSVHYHLRRFDESESFYRKALEIVRPCNYPRADISIGLNLGLCLQARGDLSGAREVFEAVRPIIEKGNDPLNEPLIFRYLGELLMEEMRIEQAEAMLDEGFRLSKNLEIEPYVAETLCTFYGILPMCRGDLAAARDRLERGLEISRKLNLTSSEHAALTRLVHVCAASGDFAAASRYLESAGPSTAPPKELSYLLRSAGWLALGLGATELAMRLAGAGSEIQGLDAESATPFDMDQQEGLLKAIRERLPQATWEESFAEGKIADPYDLIRQAMTLESLANFMGDGLGPTADRGSSENSVAAVRITPTAFQM
jgi:predicted ATPase/class 3 adenylate cyclase